MNKGNRKEFNTLLAKKLGKSQKETNKIIEDFFDSLGEFIFNEPHRLSFAGKMTISTYEREGRVYKHPKTKENIFSPSKKALRIKLGEEWKKKLNS